MSGGGCFKPETEPTAKRLCAFKKLDDGQSHTKIVSVNFPCALFSLSCFLILEGGNDRLFLNASMELPLIAA